MDFFKSVFSQDDPDLQEDEDQQEEEEEKEESSPNANPSEDPGSWSFGGFMKTIATRSESVIQTYRRDLEEFGSGLKKETEAIKEVASRAVRDLPGSLEAGASVAQDSLESVGQALDEFGGSVWKGTAEIISQSKEAILAGDSDPTPPEPSSSSRRYSRFEVMVLAVQNDAGTYTEAVEDAEDFEKWKQGFRLEDREEEIEMLLYENGVVEGFYEKFVPAVVDLEMFWSRYFYRVYKLQQAEEARAKLVKRVIATEEEEELSWEVDDDEDEEVEKKEVEEVVEASKEESNSGKEKPAEEEITVEEKKPIVEETKEDEVVESLEKPKEEPVKTEIAETTGVPEPSKVDGSKENKSTESKVEDNKSPSEDNKPPSEDNNSPSEDSKSPSEAKTEPTESSRDSDFSMISRQPSMQEDDDLGWDEIEDLGEHDDKKADVSAPSPIKEDLRKRLSIAEDDEDLSWDIEDDED